MKQQNHTPPAISAAINNSVQMAIAAFDPELRPAGKFEINN